MNTYTVWVSRLDDLEELLEIKNDLLRYDGLTWQEAMELFKLSLDQGFTLIMVKESQEVDLS